MIDISDWTIHGKLNGKYKWSWMITWIVDRPYLFEADNDNNKIWIKK